MSTSQNILSIRLQPGGFSFSTYTLLEDESFSWHDIAIEPGSDYNKRLEDHILAQEEFMQDYKKILITVVTSRFTIIPSGIGEETALKMHSYAHTDATLAETILTEKPDNAGFQILYGIDESLYLFLNRTFQDAEFHLHIATLHNYFAEKSKMGNNAKMIAQITSNQLDLLIYKNGRLQLANTYECSELDNAVYYLVNTWIQSQLNLSSDTLQLAGNKKSITELTAKLNGCIEHILPAVFPTQLFNLGPSTIDAPWDMTLMALY